ncbi:anti-sigma factor antagonist [Streptomyces sp. TRM43335]|uniref:Anti-sigma factor antagonist n=1 Tax=Streptomyces taklimakanensis TaxID=2569853 RepID=A0A6G2B696_9ACTN|nr:STAS domain-containing protein [Streptomyces taklimakanensis]MTE17795.1 anti-sigma factor antagonist [Streptomyces taklimakanensis]
MNRPPTSQPYESAGTPAPNGLGMPPSGPTLTIGSRTGDGHIVVTVEGPVDYHTSPQLLGHLMSEEVEGFPLVILDLSHVAFCDSSALGAFVEVFRHREEDGRRLALVGLQPEVRRVMELTRLVDLLPLHATAADALTEEQRGNVAPGAPGGPGGA